MNKYRIKKLRNGRYEPQIKYKWFHWLGWYGLSNESFWMTCDCNTEETAMREIQKHKGGEEIVWEQSE